MVMGRHILFIGKEKSNFPQSTKKLQKNIPIFFTFRSGELYKIALFWEKIVKISIF